MLVLLMTTDGDDDDDDEPTMSQSVSLPFSPPVHKDLVVVLTSAIM